MQLQVGTLMDKAPSNNVALVSTTDRALSGASGLSEKAELDSLSKWDHSAKAAELAAATDSERQAVGVPERLSDIGTDTAGK